MEFSKELLPLSNLYYFWFACPYILEQYREFSTFKKYSVSQSTLTDRHSFPLHSLHRRTESRSTVISGQGQYAHSVAWAQFKSMSIYAVQPEHTQKPRAHILGSRLVASCSITKNNVSRMHAGHQEENSEKVRQLCHSELLCIDKACEGNKAELS